MAKKKSKGAAKQAPKAAEPARATQPAASSKSPPAATASKGGADDAENEDWDAEIAQEQGQQADATSKEETPVAVEEVKVKVAEPATKAAPAKKKVEEEEEEEEEDWDAEVAEEEKAGVVFAPKVAPAAPAAVAAPVAKPSGSGAPQARSGVGLITPEMMAALMKGGAPAAAAAAPASKAKAPAASGGAGPKLITADMMNQLQTMATAKPASPTAGAAKKAAAAAADDDEEEEDWDREESAPASASPSKEITTPPPTPVSPVKTLSAPPASMLPQLAAAALSKQAVAVAAKPADEEEEEDWDAEDDKAAPAAAAAASPPAKATAAPLTSSTSASKLHSLPRLDVNPNKPVEEASASVRARLGMTDADADELAEAQDTIADPADVDTARSNRSRLSSDAAAPRKQSDAQEEDEENWDDEIEREKERARGSAPSSVRSRKSSAGTRVQAVQQAAAERRPWSPTSKAVTKSTLLMQKLTSSAASNTASGPKLITPELLKSVVNPTQHAAVDAAPPTTLEACLKRIAELEEEVEVERTQKLALEDRFERVQEDLHQTSEELISLEQVMQNFDDTMNHAQVKLAEKETEVEELRDQLSRAIEEAVHAQREWSQLEEKKEKELLHLRSELHVAQDKLKHAERQAELAQEKAETKIRQLEAAHAADTAHAVSQAMAIWEREQRERGMDGKAPTEDGRPQVHHRSTSPLPPGSPRSPRSPRSPAVLVPTAVGTDTGVELNIFSRAVTPPGVNPTSNPSSRRGSLVSVEVPLPQQPQQPEQAANQQHSADEKGLSPRTVMQLQWSPLFLRLPAQSVTDKQRAALRQVFHMVARTWDMAIALVCNRKAVMSPWVDDAKVSNCDECGIAFSFWYRKHHCRLCGNIFCSSCARDRTNVPYFGPAPVKVCNSCSHLVDATTAQPQHAMHGQPVPQWVQGAARALDRLPAADPAVAAMLNARATRSAVNLPTAGAAASSVAESKSPTAKAGTSPSKRDAAAATRARAVTTAPASPFVAGGGGGYPYEVRSPADAPPGVFIVKVHDSDLPLYWGRYYDTASTKFYYFNELTGQTQLERPTA